MSVWRLGLLLVAISASGSLVSWRPWADLERQADLIVVAGASGGGQPGQVLSFALRVTRVLKGDPALIGETIPVYWVLPAGAIAEGTRAQGHGLWFLQRSSSGWNLVPTMVGDIIFEQAFLPEPDGPIMEAYRYAPAAPLEDKIASEISAAIESAGAGVLRALAEDPYLLNQLHSPVIQRLYSRMSASASMDQKLLGLSGLMPIGNAAILRAALETAPALAGYPREAGVLIDSIRSDFRAIDPDSVALLGRAATGASLTISLREAAAFALCSIHTREALPYLAALLDAPEPALQQEGAGGLASFANGLPVQLQAGVPSLKFLQMPASAPYMTAEIRAHFGLRSGALPHAWFWKEWWAQHKHSLNGGAQ